MFIVVTMTHLLRFVSHYGLLLFTAESEFVALMSNEHIACQDKKLLRGVAIMLA